MLWSEIPAYQVPDTRLRAVTPLAVALTRENILDNGNHPSIVIWSVGNELSPLVGPSQTAYIAATVAAAHALDPTRPVAMAFQGYPSIGCQAGYGPLDVLGINDYFGWYPGPDGQIADETVSDRLPQPGARLLPEAGADGDRVRRRGQPRRAGRRARHVRVPEPVRRDTARTAQRNAVAQRGDLLGAPGLPRATGMDGREPVSDAARLSQGPARSHRRTQARVSPSRSRRSRRRRRSADRGARGRFATISQPCHHHAHTPRRFQPRPGRIRARRDGCAARGSCPACSTAVAATRQLRGRRARAARRARRAAAPCSSSRSTAGGATPPCSRTPSATSCAAT